MLGKILDLISSQDGQVRGARVLLGMSRNTVDRPVNRLYPFETNFKFVLRGFIPLIFSKKSFLAF